MKSPLHYTLLWLALTSMPDAGKAQSLFDDFLSTEIDTTLWTPRTPFSDSAISLSGGIVTFLNHGELLSKADFGDSLEVTGRFRFAGNIHDLFTVAIRTTGADPDPRFLNDGFHFEFAKLSDDGTRANVAQVAKYVSGVGTVVAATTHEFFLGQFYDFKIVD